MALVDEAGTGRLETFSDGVFAIAATLLVLEIGVDTAAHGDLGDALLHLWPSYLAYVTSFLTIGVIWINHHACLECVSRVDRTFLFLNIVLLLVVAFLPFPTKLVAEFLNEPGERAAVFAYTTTLAVMAVVYNVLWRYARGGRRLIGERVPQARLDAISRAFNPGPPAYGAAVLVAAFSPLAAVAVTLALAAFYLPSSALFERG